MAPETSEGSGEKDILDFRNAGTDNVDCVARSRRRPVDSFGGLQK